MDWYETSSEHSCLVSLITQELITHELVSYYLFIVVKDTKSPFLLSYHDVCSSNVELVASELDLLAKWGAPKWTLLVVPYAENDEIASFREALLAWKAQGHELALHGFKHRADLSLPRDFWGKLALHFTGQEAEFAGLNAVDRAQVLENAIRAWDRLGLGGAKGFVPPTWHAPEALAQQALQVGWLFYEERLRIHFGCASRRGHQGSIPLSLAGLSPMAQRFALFFANTILPFLPGIPRIVLHPGEVSGDRSGRIQRLLENWLARGVVKTYEELSKEVKLLP